MEATVTCFNKLLAPQSKQMKGNDKYCLLSCVWRQMLKVWEHKQAVVGGNYTITFFSTFEKLNI